MNTQNKLSDRIDWTLVILLIFFMIASVLAIASAQTTGQYAATNTNFALRQGQIYILGFIIIGITMSLDMDQFRKMAWVLYGFGVILLVGLLVAPPSIVPYINGAYSWYRFPVLGTLQPSEFMKTFTIIALARVVASHNENFAQRTFKTDLWMLTKIGVVLGVPLVLIDAQPDLGTMLVFMAIAAGIVLVSGITWKLLLPAFLAIGAVSSTLIYIVIFAPSLITRYFDDYQLRRIYSWLDPYTYSSGDAYQLTTSMSAIGSGEIFGKGYQNRQVYVPDNHTDFIFSVVGEEYGFIGASIIVSLFFLLIYHLTKVSLQTKSPFNAYVCAGIISMITFHAFQNIGMTIQVLPITGIPLPLISYGGSSLMGVMFALGLVFSMRFHHKTYMFSSEEEV
ncbi:FtsW/RodA/SpoVE family cell cycle protein [Jeotgalibacillus proteolyticus]|uniref:Rod shape-determining protein RodA n=1 Tax=Jeotgalibacillus proteolyticus TaxID=2082395 RepID=A0A2S5GCD2_9BACL|nr:FtsW/RodA/SpoVE family cell cycle protein [Jeotgalibacillus proteolyticus]PPA70571.1 rod shape-determining protein RodA [Jeotgalibacillus proteolyticus]